MGLIVSKRVESTLAASPALAAACDAVYSRCLDQSQHAFAGVRPYQIPGAAAQLHAALSASLPLVQRWVPDPPGRDRVDWALRRVDPRGEELGRDEFKAFAVELFRDSVLAGAERAVVHRVPIGIAGIAGVGAVARLGPGLVGRVMGVYAAGVVAAVYLGLS